MKYSDCIEGIFLNRPNRFIAEVLLPDGSKEVVHVKNTGRCKELLLPESRVILCPGTNPSRKTKYDLICVYKNGLGWVNIDSQAPNAVVKEWLESGNSCFKNITLLKPEYKFGDSRVDFYFEQGETKNLLEIKGCTLEIDGTGYFPDAPTIRGVKHLNELAKAAENGYKCTIAFVIAMPKVRNVLPNTSTHPEFTIALKEAIGCGVKVLYLPCKISTDEIKIIDVNRKDDTI